jgi:GTP-sensing pleiotropic transcriptional regulator CodY
MRVIFDEIERRGACLLSHMDVARRAGVGRFMVRRAIRKAMAARVISVTARQAEGDTNIIRRI